MIWAGSALQGRPFVFHADPCGVTPELAEKNNGSSRRWYAVMRSRILR
jgi:hypothetical protein